MPNILAKNGFIVGCDMRLSAGNRPRAYDVIGTKKIALLRQEHTSDIVEVCPENADRLCLLYNSPDDFVVGDGLVTRMRGVAMMMLVGDCGCVFFEDKKAGIAGIVHSGWRGTIGSINENAIKKMVSMGSDLADISVAVGPTIAQDSYEVGDEMYREFVEKDSESERFFKIIANRWHYDNSGYISYRCKRMGVKEVFISGGDTYSDPELFSYRYYTKNGIVQKNGRMAGFIVL